MRRHYETMHKDKYDGNKGKVRKEKLKQMKQSLCSPTLISPTKMLSRASFVLSEMIAMSLPPFTEGLFIKERLLKASDIFCPNQKKLFEG